MKRCAWKYLFLLSCLLWACGPAEQPVNPPVEPSNPSDSVLVENDGLLTVEVENVQGGTVKLLYQGDTVTPPFSIEKTHWLTVIFTPDDQHILTGSNIVKGCAARDSFQVKMDTVIRPVFEEISPATPTERYKICNYNIRYYNGPNDNANTGNRSWTIRKDKVFEINGGKIGEVTGHLYDVLTGIQWGKREDTFGWTYQI